MRPLICQLGALALTLTVLAGCGMTFTPRVATGDTGRPPVPTEDGLSPRGPSTWAGSPSSGSLIDEVCRARATPSGWIVVAYAVGGENCPPARDLDEQYNVKVIERYEQKRVGWTMIVCADQRVPRDWVRERAPDGSGECPGARVGDDAPTVFAMRRVR